METSRTRSAAARGPIALATAAFALASAAGAAAQVVCVGGGNAIGISIDGSGSITSPVFQDVQEQIADFVESTSGFSTGAVNENLYYANVWNTALQSSTGSFETNAGGVVSAAIDAFPYPGGGTDISIGLRDLETQFAALPADSGAPIAIVFTDGSSQGDTVAAANALRTLGVTVAAVGLGSGVQEAVLNQIASERDDGSELVFRTDDFADIGDLFDDVITNIDSDGDGVNDCEDGCPEDPDKTEPGECGCGEPETCNDKKGKKFGKGGKGGKRFGPRHDKKKFEEKVDRRFKKFNKDFDDDFEKGGFHGHGHGSW